MVKTNEVKEKLLRNICDWILETTVPNHMFLFQYTYLSLQHEKYCIPNNIS